MLPEIFLALQFYFSFDLNIITDEPLHPMVKEALQDQGPMLAYKDNAYVYLLGLVAAEGDDSFEVGKKRFISMESANGDKFNQAPDAYPKVNWVQIVAEERLCNLKAGKAEYIACIQKLKKSCDEQASLIKPYQFILDNYNKVFLASNAKSPSDSSMVDWDTLAVFRAVGTLENYYRYHRSQCVLNVDKNALVQEIGVRGKSLRALKSETDDLTTNVMLLVTLQEFYRWQVYSFRNGLTELEQLSTDFFALQKKGESGLKKVLLRMIAHDTQMLENVYQQSLSDKAEYWKVSLFFKKNQTINDSTLFFRQAILDSELSIDRYLQDRQLDRLKPHFRWWRINNLLGEIMSTVTTPRFLNVVVDMNNLDLTIRLSDIVVNYTELVDNNQLHDLPLSKRNPYDNSLPYFDESGRWLCFKVPEELKSQDECMYLH